MLSYFYNYISFILQTYILIWYLCNLNVERLSKCQEWVEGDSCFLPILVTKKYPAVNLPDIE